MYKLINLLNSKYRFDYLQTIKLIKMNQFNHFICLTIYYFFVLLKYLLIFYNNYLFLWKIITFSIHFPSFYDNLKSYFWSNLFDLLILRIKAIFILIWFLHLVMFYFKCLNIDVVKEFLSFSLLHLYVNCLNS